MADENLSYKWSNMSAGDILDEFQPDMKTFQPTNNSSSNLVDRPDGSVIVEQDSGQTLRDENDAQMSEDFEYDMKNAERGCFIIFLHDEYDQGLKASPRKGAATDATRMYQIAKILGFEHVRICRNFDKKSILNLLDRIRSGSHHGYDCFACAILSHGEKGDVIYARDATMELKEFIEPFSADKCPTLSGKPKLFFIQACRGSRADHLVKVHPKIQCDADQEFEFEEGGVHGDEDRREEDMEVEQTPLKPVMIPTQADFLIAHATPSNFAAWRKGDNGSWFVLALLECFQKHGQKLELMQIMTKVNNKVAGCPIKGGTVAQIPSFASQLRAEVKFEPKRSEPKHSRMEHSRGYATLQERLPQVCSDNWM